MTATAFDPRRMAFTRAAHLAAQTQVYARWFPRGVEFVDTTETVRDLDYAIDCQLAVTVSGFRAPLRLSVQERFRDATGPRFPDVTITEWNLASGLPSELHKLDAQLFVYGFYDAERGAVVAARAYSVPAIATGLASGRLRWTRKRRCDQEFIAIPISDLEQVGAQMFTHYNPAADSTRPLAQDVPTGSATGRSTQPKGSTDMTVINDFRGRSAP